MQISFNGRLQGVYLPKDPSKFNSRVPLNLVGRGVIQVGTESKIGVTTDQVQGYRCTLWVDADESTAVHDRLVSLVGKQVAFEVLHELVPVKVSGSTMTSMSWRDSMLLDTLAIE